jgi:hypothetical protein
MWSTRFVLLKALLAAISAGCAGSPDPVTAPLEVDRPFLERHTDVTVSGRVIDETGKQLKGGRCIIIGYRDEKRAGTETRTTVTVWEHGKFTDRFDASIRDVRAATVVLERPGFTKTTYRITVPKAYRARPTPIVRKGLYVVMYPAKSDTERLTDGR